MQQGLKYQTYNNEQQETESPYELFYFVITRERNIYEDINKRVDKMMEKERLMKLKYLKSMESAKNMTSMVRVWDIKRFLIIFTVTDSLRMHRKSVKQ